jgi:Ca2+-binding RTX toxin-like protein
MLKSTKTHRPKLSLETLEERANPSSYVNGNGTLVVVGTNASDQVAVQFKGGGSGPLSPQIPRYEVVENGRITATYSLYSMQRIKDIWFDAKGGHDTFSNMTSLRVSAFGGAGNDKLNGGTAGDWLNGGTGNDTLDGGGAVDTLDAVGPWSAPDSVYAVNYLFGKDGGDTLKGNNGTDYLHGGNHGDRLDGGAGNDFLYGEGGADTMYGDAGNDKLYGGIDGQQDYMGGDPYWGPYGRDTFYVEQYWNAKHGMWFDRDTLAHPTLPGGDVVYRQPGW